MANPELQQIILEGVGPQRGRYWEFDAVANNVQFSFQTDGGDKDCSWSLDDSGDHDDVLPNPGAIVRLYDDDGLIWQGIFTRFEGDPWEGGAALEYFAEGTGIRASLTEHQSELIFHKHTNFRDAVQQATGPVGGYIDAIPAHLSPVLASLTFPEDSQDYQGRTPADIWKAIFSYASDLLPPFRWHVRADRSGGGGSPYLEVYPWDATPKYFVSLAEGITATAKTDLHRIINRVRVKWTKKSSVETEPDTIETATAADNTSWDLLGGIFIDKTIDATADLFDFQSALGLANRQLQDFATLRPTGGSITLDYGVVVRDQAGEKVPLWRIYPGVVIELTDVTISDAAYFGNRYPIVGVSWNEAERQCTLQLGELNTLDRQILHTVQKNQTALTRHSEGITGVVKNEQKNAPSGVPALNAQGKIDQAVIPHPLAYTIPFDIECGLPVQNTDAGLAIGQFALTISFACSIVGYRLISDAAGTVLVNVRFGAFTAFPGSDVGFVAVLATQARNENLFSTKMDLAAGTVIQFTPDMTGASLPDSTYLSLELLAERTI